MAQVKKASKEQVKKNLKRSLFLQLVEFFRFVRKKNKSLGGGWYGYVGVATWMWVFWTATAEEWTRAWNEYSLVGFIVWELLFDPFDEIIIGIWATVASVMWPLWWFIHNMHFFYAGVGIVATGWLYQRFFKKSRFPHGS